LRRTDRDGTYIPRIITSRFFTLTQHFPVTVITGARQTGKTTLVQNIYKDKADYVVFDPSIDIENARADPEFFLNNHKTPVILDEIQYAPEIVSVIKRRVDKNRTPGQYILTGSQQWGVLKSISESLAGRAVFLELNGFDIREASNKSETGNWIRTYLNTPDGFFSSDYGLIHTTYTITEHIFRGWLPQAVFTPLEILREFYNSYIRTYIERDVRLIADIADYQLFGKFFRLLTALTAQEINFTQLGRELGITPQTAGRWVDILKSTFQWYEVPAFSGNSIKRISLKPKGYISDTGLICAAQMISKPDIFPGHPLWGALFETAVVMDIIKKIGEISYPPELYHWRSHAGAEVDLILKADNRYYPIEIKGTTQVSRNDTRGITAFRRTYPDLNIVSGLVICLADRMFPLSENDYAVPFNVYFV
jgi:predicted AAA+ superfamily ATPase